MLNLSRKNLVLLEKISYRAVSAVLSTKTSKTQKISAKQFEKTLKLFENFFAMFFFLVFFLQKL